MRLKLRSIHFVLLCCILSAFSTADAADYTEPTTNMQFILVKGGTFDMGDVRGTGYDIERPARKVSVGDFFMSMTEVTFLQYDKFCEATKRVKPDDNGWGRDMQPVINVSWRDARDFARWLSSKTGKTFRLPTEAEWEYAARGGRTTEFWWGDAIGKNNANCKNCGSKWDGQKPAPVGAFAVNPYGLYDLNGNVYEWCEDDRHDSYLGAPQDGSAWHGAHKSGEKILRSGSFSLPDFESRARARSWDRPDAQNIDYGIRLVMN